MKLIVLLALCAPLAQPQGLGTPIPEVAANRPAQAMGLRERTMLQMRESLEVSREVSRRSEPLMSIAMPESSGRPIRVVGAVNEPLTFQTSGPVTLLEAIARAGGLTPVAGSVILVSKAQAGPGQPASPMQRVSVQALIEGTRPELNLRLTGGEEVHVPQAGKVFIVGNVKRPGAFPVPYGAETSILRMLALAEGLEPFAGKRAYIYRREASGRQHELSVDLSKIMQRKAPDVTLLASDILNIPDTRQHRVGSVILEKLVLFGNTAGAPAPVYGAR